MVDPALAGLRPQATLFEGDQVALQPLLQVDPLEGQSGDPALARDVLMPPLPVGFGEGCTQQLGIGVDLGQLTEHRGLELLTAQAVLVAGGPTMTRARSAGVVVVATRAVMGGGAHQRTAAAIAHQAQAAEQEGTGVGPPLGGGARAASPQALGRLEDVGLDDGLMSTGMP